MGDASDRLDCEVDLYDAVTDRIGSVQDIGIARVPADIPRPAKVGEGPCRVGRDSSVNSARTELGSRAVCPVERQYPGVALGARDSGHRAVVGDSKEASVDLHSGPMGREYRREP